MENLTLLLPNLSPSRTLNFFRFASRDRYVHEKYANGHVTLNEVFTVSFIALFSEKTSIFIVLKFKSSRNIKIFMITHYFLIKYYLKILEKNFCVLFHQNT
jgi:hypothetical protein